VRGFARQTICVKIRSNAEEGHIRDTLWEPTHQVNEVSLRTTEFNTIHYEKYVLQLQT
jgi:hypothetical protein